MSNPYPPPSDPGNTGGPADPLRKPSDPNAGAGSYPPPGGSYPPPGASYPPPGASYPPPGSSYPPPGAYPPPPPSYGQAPGGFPPAPPPGYGQTPPQLSLGAALSYGWDKFSQNALNWIVLLIITLAINIVVSFAFRGFNTDGFTVTTSVLSLVGTVVSFVIGILFQAAYVRGALSELDGQRPSIPAFFRFNNLAAVFGVAIVVGIITGVGFLLIILPGLVLLYLTWYALTFAIDHNANVGAALSGTFRLTTQHFGELFPLALVCLILNVVGALLCGVGLLVSIPVTLIAGTYAFRVLTGGVVSPARNAGP